MLTQQKQQCNVYTKIGMISVFALSIPLMRYEFHTSDQKQHDHHTSMIFIHELV